MIILAVTKNCDLYEKAARILREYFYCKGQTDIDFSRPKPAFAGTYCGMYDFNISHSGKLAAIAVSDKTVGCDIEELKGRAHRAVMDRLTSRERAGLESEEDFLRNWTAKEAFIKMHGFSIATHLKRLEYFDGGIWLDETKQPCTITHLVSPSCVIAVCGEEGVTCTTEI